MTDLFKTVALQLMTPECFDQYFVNFNFFHGECMKSTISKALGIGIVIASMAVKVPQILKIIQNKSGKGISLTGVLLELTAITSFSLYSYLKSFPFSAWGDGPSVGIQTLVILGLILYYRGQRTELGLFLSAYFAGMFVVAAGVVPFALSLSVLWSLQILNMPIAAAGKGVQILANYRNQSTGQLSVVTCWLLFLGTLARIFTSVQETGDMAVILTFITAATLNGLTVFQCHYYAKPSRKRSKKAKAKGNKSD